MAKPTWGTKRTCPGCGARFYDLKKEPAVCPTCETAIEVQVAKPRKPVVAAKEVAKPAEPEAAKKTDDNDEDAVEGLDEVVLEVEDDDEDDDDSLIEDTSDLEASDGMDEVKDHMEAEISDDT